MKKTIALCAALIVSGAAIAQKESTYAVTVDFPYVSKYVFRGVELARDSFQPSVELSTGDLYLGVWGNLPGHKENDMGLSKEVDLYVGYTPKLTEKISADIGLTYYWYPRYSGSGPDDSMEVFAGLNTTVGNFTPSGYIYRDIDLDVTTLQASVGYSIPLQGLGTSLDLSATFGGVIPDDGESYCYYAGGVNVPVKLSDMVKLNFGLSYTENDLDDGEDPGLWATFGVSATF